MDLKMEAQATERMISALVNRLERDGHLLTPTAVGKIHYIISDCMPDRRSEGTQKELAELIMDRVTRDER